MNSKQCVIVIPVHSPAPSAFELISFRQCFKVLEKHPIKIVAPEGLNLDEYLKAVPHFDVLYIKPFWQASLQNYNRLKYSRYFYNLFNKYEFILTYEPDAFVFYDNLNEWCSKNYDYIGAPWFEGFDNPTDESKFMGVGNSGFSLRKTKTIQKILKTFYYKNPDEYHVGNKKKLIATLKYPYRKLMNVLSGENYTLQHNYKGYSEDRLFCLDIAKTNTFNIAPINEALRFSFEVNPRRLYEMNNQQLPMGCHAWWKYDPDFWKPFIVNEGYVI